MKKLMTVFLSVLMAFCMVTSISAEGPTPTEPTDKTTDLTYAVDAAYTWTIPTDTAISTTATTLTNGVTIEGTLEAGSKVEVKVSSGNGFKVKAGDNELAYTLKAGEVTVSANDTVIASYNAGASKTEVALTAQVTGTAVYAGTYTDTLTFAATYTSAQ